MSLPVFFTKQIAPLHQYLVLDEDTSRHVSQVLRMREGERLQLTDGAGNLLTASITEAHKKHSAVKIIESKFIERSPRKTTIAISLLKNANRFEWFLEKATELGITEIVPLLCERTERQHFRLDRMKAVLVSAMLQSQQSWLPELREPVQFTKFVSDDKNSPGTQKFIAHLVDEQERTALSTVMHSSSDNIILIGPEGDFKKEEVALALQQNYVPVSLGETRLRTETAGIVAAVLSRCIAP
jgi:16S rRNA (uracil1498-N3)-methyltransferase